LRGWNWASARVTKGAMGWKVTEFRFRRNGAAESRSG
jgi:hypothetical protein